MNYRHVYMLIVEHAKSEMKNGLRPSTKYQKRKYFSDSYFEFHHILPKSLYPNWINRKSNLVCLTAREHFFCHQLLTKIYPCWQMWVCLKYFFKYTKNSKSYQSLIEQVHSHLNDYYSSDDFKNQILSRDYSYLTPEYRLKLSNAIKSTRSTVESKNKTAEASKKMWEEKHDDICNSIRKSFTPQRREQISNYQKEYAKNHYSEILERNKASSEKISNSMKLLWENPTYRDNMLLHNNIKPAQEANCKKIRCIQTNEIFDSVKDARLKYGKTIHISDVLNGRRKYAGKLDDGTKLSWEYV